MSTFNKSEISDISLIAIYSNVLNVVSCDALSVESDIDSHTEQ